MAGHSHWARIKRQKGVTDSRRGKLFSKLSRHIMSAVRQGGADSDMNLKLQYAIEKAREYSMPKENIERAIARAAGTGADGAAFEEIVYEGYGPGGTAIVIEALTDNKNRAATDIRTVLEKSGGSLAGAGAVAWNFEKKGIFWVEGPSITEERLIEEALALGADDVEAEENGFQVTCSVKNFSAVKEGFAARGIAVAKSEIGRVPKTVVALSEDQVRRMESILEALDDLDDVQNLYANYRRASPAAQKNGGPS